MSGGGRCDSKTHPPSMGEYSQELIPGVPCRICRQSLVFSAVVAICMVLVRGRFESCKFQELSETCKFYLLLEPLRKCCDLKNTVAEDSPALQTPFGFIVPERQAILLSTFIEEESEECAV